MSLNSLANAEIARMQAVQANQPALHAGLVQSAALAGAPVTVTVAAPQQQQFSNALEVLTRYLPTEVVTLYVAAVSWTKYPNRTADADGFLAPDGTYYGFLIATPVLLFLIYWSKRASAGQPLSVSKALIWKMFAATVAFGIWALSVPHNPILEGNPSAAGIAGLLAMFVSALLTIIEPIVS